MYAKLDNEHFIIHSFCISLG